MAKIERSAQVGYKGVWLQTQNRKEQTSYVVHRNGRPAQAFIASGARRKGWIYLIGYSGLHPSVHQSDARIYHGLVAGHGNPFLRTAAVQVTQVQYFIKQDSRLRRNYWRLTLDRKHHPNVAKLDTARKVLKAVWWVWHKQEAYRPL